MKPGLMTLLLVLGLAAFSVPVLAQEDGGHSPEFTDNATHNDPPTDDKVIPEHESHTRSVGTSREFDAPKTTTVAPATPAQTTNTKAKSQDEKEGKETMSFNFLYFMIQKFKISDIIDD